VPVLPDTEYHSACLTTVTVVTGFEVSNVEDSYCVFMVHDNHVLLQDMIDKLIEIGRCCGMEMNVEKTKVMKISRQPSPVTIMID